LVGAGVHGARTGAKATALSASKSKRYARKYGPGSSPYARPGGPETYARLSEGARTSGARTFAARGERTMASGRKAGRLGEAVSTAADGGAGSLKLAKKNHPLDRLKERAPGVSPDLLPALEQFALSQNLDPKLTYHAPLPGGAHAVLGAVGKPGRQKHVVKTVLSPSMSPPGTKLPPLRHTFITGVPGAGKTTEGQRMSKETGLPLISLDGIAASKHWASGADAKRFIKKNLNTPHIVEGTQILGFRSKDLKGHKVYLIEQPKKVIVNRLVRRGWTNAVGDLRKGEAFRTRAEAFHDRMAGHAARFKKEEKPELLRPKRLKTAGLFTTDKDRAPHRKALLKRYAKLYEGFDGAHGPAHRDDVMRTAKMLATKHDPSRVELAEAAALLHDVGISRGRAKHEQHAADMLQEDPEFHKSFGFLDKHRVLHAVKQHRNSSGRPFTRMARIVSDADRTPGTGTTSPMARAVAFGREHFPDATEDEQLLRAGKVLSEKFPPGGVRTYMPETAALLAKGYDPISEAYSRKDLKTLGQLAKTAALMYTVGYPPQYDEQLAKGRAIKKPGGHIFTAAGVKKFLRAGKGVTGPDGKKKTGVYSLQVSKRNLKPFKDEPGRFVLTRGRPEIIAKVQPYKKTEPTPRGSKKINAWRRKATSVGSSHLDAVKYNKNNKKLQVLFRSGALYEYDGVSAQRAKVLQSARSKGKYFNKYIRSEPYKYRRLA